MIVQETQDQVEKYAQGLSAEQIYIDMLEKIVQAPARIHMRVAVRMLIPIIDRKIRGSYMNKIRKYIQKYHMEIFGGIQTDMMNTWKRCRKMSILENRFIDKIKREYPVYSMLDTETKKTVSEIAKKYPYSVEWVATILIKCEFDLKKTEAYIMSQLMR